MDVSEKHLQLLHHPTVLGGSGVHEDTKLIALSGLGKKATAVRIIPKSIKDVKAKAPLLSSVMSAFDNGTPLDQVKCSTGCYYHYKNIIPILDLLVKSFIQLDETDPASVALHFLKAMYLFDKPADTKTKSTALAATPQNVEPTSDTDDDKAKTPVTSLRSPVTKADPVVAESFVTTFDHVIQFCYLCLKGKIPSIAFTIPSDDETTSWHYRLKSSHISQLPSCINSTHHSTFNDEDDSTDTSYCSIKDRHMIHTLLKISDTLDQNSLRITSKSEKKEPGFKKLEPHRQLLILNATAIHPFEMAAKTPTSFYMEFLSQKTKFKAKDMFCITSP